MAIWRKCLPLLSPLVLVLGFQLGAVVAWQQQAHAGKEPPPASGKKGTVSVLVRSPEEAREDKQVKPAAAEEPVGEELELGEEVAAEITLQATSFSSLIPGVSNTEQVQQEFGEPTSSLAQSGTLVQTYMLEPYDRVGVVLREDLLESIHLQLDGPVYLEKFCRQLELPPGEGVDLPESDTQFLERLYPERGVSLLYRVVDDSLLVDQVNIHRIRQRDFTRAAVQLEQEQYSRALRLVHISQQLDPGTAEAFAIEARIAARTGQTAVALNALTRVRRLDPGDNESRLLQAWLWARTNRRQMAITQAREIRNSSQVAPLVRARATLVLADLMGQAGNVDASLQYYNEAINRATVTAKETGGRERDAGILVLIEAHRAVAREIAHGDWKKEEKADAIGRWLDVADQLAAQLQSRQAAPPLLELEGLAARLDIRLDLEESFDETVLIRQLVEHAELFIEQSGDALTSQEVHWRIGRALFTAAQLARRRGAHDEAIAHGSAAYRHLQAADSPRQEGLEGKKLVGGVTFLVGSEQAISRQDHQQAVRWYQRALTHVAQPGMEHAWTTQGWHGERLVSMGLSFWKTGDRERGMELTEQGIKWVEKGVEEDGFPPRYLAVPYGNIAVMYRALGRDEQARGMAQRAARLQPMDDSGVKRR
jgi:tetratricopeptide (TPR) repeat protein